MLEPVHPRGGSRYVFGATQEERTLAEALRYRPLVKRSALTALVVGTILTAINQGDAIVANDLAPDMMWKIPLTYVMPYCVATWGALTASRVRD